MTNVIRVMFVHGGRSSGREYTYYTGVRVEVGDMVECETKRGIMKAVVTQVDVPEEEITCFGDRAKAIIGKAAGIEGGVKQCAFLPLS